MRKVLIAFKKCPVISCHNYLFLELNISPEECKCENKKLVTFESHLIGEKCFILSNSSASMKMMADLHRTPFPPHVSVN